VLGGAALVVLAIVGTVKFTGVQSQTLSSIGIKYDFEPASGTHGGTVASAVKADIGAFGAASEATVSRVVDNPSMACYFVRGDGSSPLVSLVEIDGKGAGSVGGISRWTGNAWGASPTKARATACEKVAPAP
jgi:hypothetical protein